MCGTAILAATLAVGVDVGWRPHPDGGLEYIIQIEPHLLDSLRTGEDIQSSIPPGLRGVRAYRITVGTEQLPREGVSEATETADRSPGGSGSLLSSPAAARSAEAGPHGNPFGDRSEVPAAPSPDRAWPSVPAIPGGPSINPDGPDGIETPAAPAEQPAAAAPPAIELDMGAAPGRDWSPPGWPASGGADAEPSESAPAETDPADASDSALPPWSTLPGSDGPDHPAGPPFDEGEDSAPAFPQPRKFPASLADYEERIDDGFRALAPAGRGEEEGGPSAKMPPEPATDSGDEPGREAARPWLPFTLALAGFFGSLGGMLYFGWIAWDYRARYRGLLERVIETRRGEPAADEPPDYLPDEAPETTGFDY